MSKPDDTPRYTVRQRHGRYHVFDTHMSEWKFSRLDKAAADAECEKLNAKSERNKK